MTIITNFQIVISDHYTNEWDGKTKFFYLELTDFCIPSVGMMIRSDIPGLSYYDVFSVSFDGKIYHCRKANVEFPTNPTVQAQYLLDNGWVERQ